jgi:hypothetical protein
LEIAGDAVAQWRLIEFSAHGDEIVFEAREASFVLCGRPAIQDCRAGKFGAAPAIG